MSIDELVKQLIAQFPMVAIILVILWQQTQNHQKTVEFYRAQQQKFLDWLMKNCEPDQEIVGEIFPDKKSGSD